MGFVYDMGPLLPSSSPVAQGLRMITSLKAPIAAESVFIYAMRCNTDPTLSFLFSPL